MAPSVKGPRAHTSRVRTRTHPKAWVRKNMIMDQRKLDAARRTLGVRTETEAVDVALDLVAFRDELVRGVAAVRRVGGILGSGSFESFPR